MILVNYLVIRLAKLLFGANADTFDTNIAINATTRILYIDIIIYYYI